MKRLNTNFRTANEERNHPAPALPAQKPKNDYEFWLKSLHNVFLRTVTLYSVLCSSVFAYMCMCRWIALCCASHKPFVSNVEWWKQKNCILNENIANNDECRQEKLIRFHFFSSSFSGLPAIRVWPCASVMCLYRCSSCFNVLRYYDLRMPLFYSYIRFST